MLAEGSEEGKSRYGGWLKRGMWKSKSTFFSYRGATQVHKRNTTARGPHGRMIIDPAHMVKRWNSQLMRAQFLVHLVDRSLKATFLKQNLKRGFKRANRTNSRRLGKAPAGLGAEAGTKRPFGRGTRRNLKHKVGELV
ncbi:MAG: hypothetical protein Q9204_006664 [Flavoplaca sp. TL-2023a]